MYVLILSLIRFPRLSDMLQRLSPMLFLVFEVTVLKRVFELKFYICSLSLSCELHTQSVGDSKILFSRLAVSVPVSRAVKVSHARLKE